MVRLKDIAEAAGVSTGTVSAALSGTGRIGIHTREQIRKLAGEMNYQPSSSARMLRKKPAIDAGMVIADEQTRYVPEFINWCERYHLRHQLELISSAGKSLPTLLEDNFAAGTLHTGYLGKTVRAFLAEHPEFPFVALNEKSDFCVRSNFASGAKQAIQYLTALGHGNIWMSVGDQIYDLHQQLKQGLEAAIREFQFETTPKILIKEVRGVPHDRIMQRSIEYARCLLREKNRPTALFCCGHIEAQAFIYAGLELGLRVPDDLSIVSVGDTELAVACYPAITTLGNDYHQLILQAMLLLQRRIAGIETEPQDILVDTKLDIRNSTGKASLKKS